MSLAALRDAGFDVATRNHAEAILAHDFPGDLDLLVRVLCEFRISLEEVITGGGGEAGLTQRLRHELSDLNWVKHNFSVHGRLENGTIIFQFCPDVARIDQITIVCDGETLPRILNSEGLRIDEKR